MISFGSIRFLPALLCLGAVLVSGAAAELPSAGDRAGSLGDFRNAADFYTRELEKSTADPERWCRTALKLGEVRLRLGDLAGASEILAEFRRRYPAQSPGTLPGEILAAEGKYAEAEKYLLSLRHASIDAAARRRAVFALGELALRRGKPEAEKYFREISNGENIPEEWRLRALSGEIHAIINAGRYAEAERMLKDASSSASAHFIPLELLLLGVSGKIKEFAERWTRYKPDFVPRPEPLLCEALLRAGEAAGKQKLYRAGAAFIGDAFEYAGTDSARRQILRDQINMEGHDNPEKAIAACTRFTTLFPAAADSFEVKMLQGKFYFRIGKYSTAQECFAGLLAEPGISESDRISAALAAAAAAERTGDRIGARRMFDYALAHSPLERQGGIRFLLVDFYLRQKEYSAAAGICEALLKMPGADRGKARFHLLQALMAEKLYRKAEPVAKELANSSNPEYAAFGSFRRAMIAEAVGRRSEARKLYLAFVAAWPENPDVAEAKMAAATLAANSGEHADAAKEFAAFSQQFPQHAKAPAALCMAIRSRALEGNAAEVRRLAKELTERYPQSPERAAGALLLAEFLFSGGNPAEALKIADALIASGKSPETAAESLFLAARIDASAGRTRGALERFRKLLNDYPGSGVAAEAALAAGNCASQLNDYKQAEGFYRRAAELRPGGVFAAVASGRVADTLLARHGEGASPENLREALEIFRRLADNSTFPPLALQALYKSGVCLEYQADDRGALAAYEKVLYVAGELKRQGTACAPEWCSRAAYAALRVIANSRLPDASQRAGRILRQYAALELPDSGAELQMLAREIEKRYNYTGIKE